MHSEIIHSYGKQSENNFFTFSQEDKPFHLLIAAYRAIFHGFTVGMCYLQWCITKPESHPGTYPRVGCLFTLLFNVSYHLLYLFYFSFALCPSSETVLHHLNPGLGRLTELLLVLDLVTILSYAFPKPVFWGLGHEEEGFF